MIDEFMSKAAHMQKEMDSKLSDVKIQSSNDSITISGNALGEVNDVHIAEEYLVAERREELEDKLVYLINDFITNQKKIQAEQSKSLLSDLMPPGLGGLF
jgi:DNA-binding protein YbaB